MKKKIKKEEAAEAKIKQISFGETKIFFANKTLSVEEEEEQKKKKKKKKKNNNNNNKRRRKRINTTVII